MQQTGKYYIYAIEDDRRVISPIAHAFIYFIREENQEVIALTVKTDEEGNYDFNLDAGKYIVATSAGGIEQVLANGSLFEITNESQVDAFEKWLNLSNDENVDSALLEKFRELMQRTEAAAQETEKAYQKVEETLTTKTEESLQQISDETSESLDNISQRTNAGLSAITIEKNTSILEIKQTTAESKESLDQSIENANTAKENIEQTTQNCVITIDQKVIEAESQIDDAKDTAIQEVENTLEKSNVLPVSHIYWGLSIDFGSLHLDGSEKLRSDYPDLWKQVSDNAVTDLDWISDKNRYGNVGKYSTGNGTTTFRLPLINGYIKGGGSGYQEAGLPNIEGQLPDLGWRTASDDYRTGAFVKSAIAALHPVTIPPMEPLGGDTISFNASRSSSIYGKSTTVEVNAIKGYWQVRAYGIVTNTASVDILAFINDINKKASLDDLNEGLAGKQDKLDILGEGDVLTTGSVDFLDTVGFISTRSSAVDSNGFIKRASPIINLYNNRIETNDQFAEEPIFEKLGVGIYKISNTLGLAKGEEDGDWYIETPVDRNKQTYFNVEWEQDEDNNVIIRTYQKEEFYEEYERYDDAGNILADRNGTSLKFLRKHEINGDLIDIVENRFVALRFIEKEQLEAD